MDDQLKTFIRQAFEQGQTAEQIQTELLSVGWEAPLVNQAINEVMTAPTINRAFVPAPTQDFSQSISQPVQTQTSGIIQEIGSYKSVKPMQMSSTRVSDLNHPKIVRKFFPPGMAVSIALVLAGIGSIGGGYYYYISRDGNLATAQKSVERNPVVNADNLKYNSYRNNEYNFIMNVPRTWNIKEYPTSAYPNEQRIMFAESKFIAQSDFRPGNYAWIKIYPVSNQKNYSNFLSLGAQLNENPEIRLSSLDNKPAVLHQDFVAAENNGSVFELHLPTQTTDDGTEEFTPIGKLILESFRFF